MFGLKTAIRLQEVGIVSNRISASYGELVLKLCTHRPSHAGRRFGLKIVKILLLTKKMFEFFVRSQIRFNYSLSGL